jgi:hypothetical protein
MKKTLTFAIALLAVVALTTGSFADTLTGASLDLVPGTDTIAPGGSILYSVEVLVEGDLDPASNGFSAFSIGMLAAPAGVTFSDLVLNPDYFDYLSSFPPGLGVTLAPDSITATCLANIIPGMGPVLPPGLGIGTPFTVFGFTATFASVGSYDLVPEGVEVGIMSGASMQIPGGPSHVDVVPEPMTMLLVGGALAGVLLKKRS